MVKCLPRFGGKRTLDSTNGYAMAKRLAVVVSQGQSHNPVKRNLEEEVVAGLMLENGIDVTVVPHLYDLTPDGTGILALQGVKGDFVVISWLYERAAHWLLDRNEIHGHVGAVALTLPDDDEDDDESGEEVEEDKSRVIDEREIPNRNIYCLDFRAANTEQAYIDEVKRIASESGTQVVDLLDWVSGTPKPEQMQRFLKPTNGTALGSSSDNDQPTQDDGSSSPTANGSGQPLRIDEEAGRRWYPVIDFGRCTNCMECIDFCLFGVYGVDGAETILVEQPDNCRKGCPACSRVCPENAIIFPQHKSPAIAGAPGITGGLKIDLSKLFGAPEGSEDAVAVAARERDEQLLLAGRDAVGLTVGIPKRQAEKSDEPKDELDDLLDELDDLDL